MKRTVEQIKDILQGTRLWQADLHWYDSLLAIEFRVDSSGEMYSGGGQAMREDIKFRYEISANLQIHFEFFDTFDSFWKRKTFERNEKNAFKTVEFQLLEGSFAIDEPYDEQHTYRYILRFSSDPFPVGMENPKPLLDYYGWQIQ